MPPRRLRPRPAGRRILFETVKKGGGAATGASMTDSKRVGVFSRLGLVHTGSGRGKKAFHHFPPPSFVHSLLRHAARLLGRASERAPTRLSARSVSLTLSLSLSLSLSLPLSRHATLGTGGCGGRAPAEWQAVWFSRLGDDDDAPLASDGRRTDADGRELSQSRLSFGCASSA